MLKKNVILLFFALTILVGLAAAGNDSTDKAKVAVSMDTIKTFGIHPINLASQISYYDNQYSGLYIGSDSLYLMSECRLQDNMPAYLDRASLKELQTAVKDSTYVPSFERITINGLDKIRAVINDRKQIYEGLEAMVINANVFYFSIETTEASDSCYIVKGTMTNKVVNIDAGTFLGIPKPKNSNGQYIDNAGFESLEKIGNQLYAFFEYNYFSGENKVAVMDLNLNQSSLTFNKIAKTPYRITDVSYDTESMQLFGLNYFFKGDAAYQLNSADSHYSEIFSNGGYHSFNQIITLQMTCDGFKTKVLGVLPSGYQGFNYEGLAKYGNGFFIINDKFTPVSGKNHSTLTYFSY